MTMHESDKILIESKNRFGQIRAQKSHRDGPIL